MAKQTEKSQPTHVVTREFRDLFNFDQVHEVGDDVSHFEPERLASLVENGQVEELELVDTKNTEDAAKKAAKQAEDLAKKQAKEAEDAAKKAADEAAKLNPPAA